MTMLVEVSPLGFATLRKCIKLQTAWKRFFLFVVVFRIVVLFYFIYVIIISIGFINRSAVSREDQFIITRGVVWFVHM